VEAVATASDKVPLNKENSLNRESRQVVLEEASNELIFAVVGHAGSGTSIVANQLRNLLQETVVGSSHFEVEILKARNEIIGWAKSKGLPLPESTGEPSLSEVAQLQDYGDRMRSEITFSGEPDHAAIAQALVLRIRKIRAEKTKVEAAKGQPIKPDGKPRAYILDSIRHPAEVQLLRHVYKDAFVLIGVVCEEEKRIVRIGNKYRDAGRNAALDFMKRDANAVEKHGQHVADAFHLSDYFVDNTVDRMRAESSNPDWDVVENLSRLVKILTHSEMVRPSVAETAMHHAFSAKMQSACLSRQVGAAAVDIHGNVVATGTNEVPKAGGGVYGESFAPEVSDDRCAMAADSTKRYCRNTREQLNIIRELLNDIKELRELGAGRKEELVFEFQKTRIGELLEFSRAVHAEMDALLSAARKGVSLVGTRLFVTTFPCHYCARHIVAAGVDEVQYIEPYPKSQALNLHKDAIAIEHTGWKAPSSGGDKVLFRPFSGVAPHLYKRAFMKDRDLKDKKTGDMRIQPPVWGTPWYLSKVSYIEIEAKLSKEAKND
jgi:deoxycytidylate deaminase